jgi:flagellar hook-basal body complex protein FliE
MDINATLAAQSYGAARPITAPDPKAAGGGLQGSFGQMANSFVETLQQADVTAQAAMTGGADPHALVQALGETQMAVETAITVRDKVVEAYLEVLRMPV